MKHLRLRPGERQTEVLHDPPRTPAADRDQKLSFCCAQSESYPSDNGIPLLAPFFSISPPPPTVVQRIARADRDQKLTFCCAQSEAAHPYLAAFGLTPSDVLLAPVYIQGFNAPFSGTSDGLLAPVYIQGYNASYSGTSGRLPFSFRFPLASLHPGLQRLILRHLSSAPSGLGSASPLTPPHLPPHIGASCIDFPSPFFTFLLPPLLVPPSLQRCSEWPGICLSPTPSSASSPFSFPPNYLPSLPLFVCREELGDEGRRDGDRRHHEIAEARYCWDRPLGSLD
ncbi:unnamed protein product [Closterium sp. Naga37s-1]|nr:unnamed protein product [Closterium sp. Naga37s-1]